MKTMRKITSLLILAVFALPTFAQEDDDRREYYDNNPREVKTLFGPNAGHGGYGAITLGYTQIDGRNGLLMGGRGAWVIGHGLGLGLGGYGFINDPQYDVADDLYYALAGGYGGFIIEPIILGRMPVHISLPILIGAGGVALTSYGEDIFASLDPYDAYFEGASAFFVAEPGVELELNLVRWLRLAFFGSYRYTTELVSVDNVSAAALQGWSAGITMKVGAF